MGFVGELKGGTDGAQAACTLCGRASKAEKLDTPESPPKRMLDRMLGKQSGLLR
jgi:hypothetical protein